MAKKNRKNKAVKKNNEEKKTKLKDPDPKSHDYMYDDMDDFSMNKDKILLNETDDKGEDSDMEEDMAEEVLPIQDSQSDSDEEGDDDDDDDDDGGGDDHGDVDDEDDDDDNMFESDEEKVVHDKAWGRSKKAFYNTDVQDEDIYASDEEAELAAEEEEKEAMILQKRLTEKLDVEDFYNFEDEDDENKADNDTNENELKVAKDLSSLSQREKLEILARDSPEFLPLLEDYNEKLAELKERYQPLLILVKHGIIRSQRGCSFIKYKQQLLLNYLVNISFYLVLKTNKERTKGHPVIKVLVQHQKLLEQTKEIEEKLDEEMTGLLEEYMEDIVNGTLVCTKDDEIINASSNLQTAESLERAVSKGLKNATSIDPLEYYNMMKAKMDNQKKAKRQKLDESIADEGVGEEVAEEDEEGKRMITYEMSKNKGLIRKRRKELKNPRVKHKVKFKKAIIKRKGQVREIQRELNRYGGESTGIKSSLTRSVKIK